MSAPTRIIDSHQHVFWHGRDDAGLVANLDEQGIAQAVLLNWDILDTDYTGTPERVYDPARAEPLAASPGLPFADAVTAARRYPDRFILGYCPHPLGRDPVERLAAAVEMYGVRICGEWKARIGLDDPRCLELFRFCGQRRLAVVFHIDVPYRPDPQTGKPVYYAEWYGGTIDNLARALTACPETVLIGHGPGFWRCISSDCDTAPEGYPPRPVTEPGPLLAMFDQFPNLCADLSGFSGLNAISRSPDFGRKFLIDHHDRLLFGRDYYDGRLHAFLQSVDLPAEVAEDIYHRNIERVLRIEA